MCAVHIHVEWVLRKKAVGYSAVTKTFRSASFGERDPAQGDSHDMPVWILLTRQFSKQWHFIHLLLSAKSLAWSCSRNQRYINMSPNPLDFTRSSYDGMTTGSWNRTASRVEKSNKLSQLLVSMKQQSWKCILAVEEACFYLWTDYQTIWLAQWNPRPDSERRILSSPKSMLTLMMDSMRLIVSRRNRWLMRHIWYLIYEQPSRKSSLWRKTAAIPDWRSMRIMAGVIWPTGANYLSWELDPTRSSLLLLLKWPERCTPQFF
jgi:hypothetical protein